MLEKKLQETKEEIARLKKPAQNLQRQKELVEISKKKGVKEGKGLREQLKAAWEQVEVLEKAAEEVKTVHNKEMCIERRKWKTFISL